MRRVLAIQIQYENCFYLMYDVSCNHMDSVLISDGGSHLALQYWRLLYLLVIRLHTQSMRLVTGNLESRISFSIMNPIR